MERLESLVQAYCLYQASQQPGGGTIGEEDPIGEEDDAEEGAAAAAAGVVVDAASVDIDVLDTVSEGPIVDTALKNELWKELNE